MVVTPSTVTAVPIVCQFDPLVYADPCIVAVAVVPPLRLSAVIDTTQSIGRKNVLSGVNCKVCVLADVLIVSSCVKK